jgi:hypothetical protein
LPIIAEHNTVAGRDADAPDPDPRQKGKPGALTEQDAGDLDWLQPAALQAVLAFAKDAYLDNQFDGALGALSIYKTVLDDPAKYPKLSAQELVRLRSDFDLMLHRLDNNLDYFGNPPGWVPMLSFQVNMVAYSQEITSSIRLLFLCRLVNKKASQLALSAASLRTTLGDLSASINRQAREYNDLQDRLPHLKQQLATILAQQTQIDRIVRERDAKLKAMAVATVEDRHRASFLKMALNVVATATKVVPVYQPALGAVGNAISALENLQSDPVGSLETLSGVPEAFSKAKVEESKKSLDDMIKKIDPTKSKTAPEYIKGLVGAGKQWAEAYNGIAKATAETAVPPGEVGAELQRIRAQDVEFQGLVDEVSSLHGKKEIFTRDLAQSVQSIGKASSQITADMRAVDAINTQLNDIVSRVDHDMLAQIKEIDRHTRERLLQYQYFMVKAYEYELLTRYQGNLHIDRLIDRVAQLLDDGKEQSWIDDPKNFSELSALYQDDLRQVGAQILARKNVMAPKRVTDSLSFPLSADEIQRLNQPNGQITINVAKKGFIGPTEENARLITIGADRIEATASGNPPTANLRLIFQHSGVSTFQSESKTYVFNHYRSIADPPITWGSRYDVVNKGPVEQEQVATSEIALLKYLLGPASPGQSELFYSHPGLAADLTVRKEVIPDGADVRVTAVQIKVKYEFTRSRPTEVILDISSSEGAPRISCDTPDLNKRSDGIGSFRRIYSQGTTLHLTAEPRFGNRVFKEWQEGAKVIGQSPTVSVSLPSYRSVRAVYGPK